MTAGISFKKIVLLTLFLAVFSFAQKKYTFSVSRQESSYIMRGGTELASDGTIIARCKPKSTAAQQPPLDLHLAIIVPSLASSVPPLII